MDGVDISSSSEVGEEEAYGTDSDLTGIVFLWKNISENVKTMQIFFPV